MKYVCTERRCGWRGEHYLSVPNPFEPADTVTGCPGCKSIDTIVNACDVPGC